MNASHSHDLLQQSVWALALLIGVASYRAPAGRSVLPFVLGLWLGAAFAHVGWLLLYLRDVVHLPVSMLQLNGVSVLFVPLGVLLVAPWREALAALPLALAVARLGCLPYDCCYPTPWHALPELLSLVGLHLAARRWPRHTTPIVLCGFGAIRLLSLPLRRALVVEPFVDPTWVAVAWIVAGLALRHRIGSAEEAREWLTDRTEPLLRSLVLMLVVWLLFPLGAEVFGDPSRARLVGSGLALALLLALRRPDRTRLSAAAIGVFGATLLIGAGVSSLAGAVLHRGPLSTPGGGASTWLVLVAVAPVFEELLYRERLLGVLRSLWGGRAAVVASSALFALGHLNPAVMPIAFAGGLVCGVLMLRTGSLAAVIGLHAGWNLGVVALA